VLYLSNKATLNFLQYHTREFMSKIRRVMHLYSHSPFYLRLMLLEMIVALFRGNKPATGKAVQNMPQPPQKPVSRSTPHHRSSEQG